MKTPSPRPPYRAWLLRCWREVDSDMEQRGHWRFNLEEPGSGMRRGFSSLPALIAWLEDRLAEDDVTDGTDDGI